VAGYGHCVVVFGVVSFSVLPFCLSLLSFSLSCPVSSSVVLENRASSRHSGAISTVIPGHGRQDYTFFLTSTLHLCLLLHPNLLVAIHHLPAIRSSSYSLQRFRLVLAAPSPSRNIIIHPVIIEIRRLLHLVPGFCTVAFSGPTPAAFGL